MNVSEKRAQSANSARSIYERLMSLPRPQDFSNNEWAKRAGVNTSFFVNLKKGSDPSIDNLRSVLGAAGTSLPEFFIDEAEGRLSVLPSLVDLREALDEALSALPRRPERRSQYLAEFLAAFLELPQTGSANPANLDELAADDQEAKEPLRAATS